MSFSKNVAENLFSGNTTVFQKSCFFPQKFLTLLITFSISSVLAQMRQSLIIAMNFIVNNFKHETKELSTNYKARNACVTKV